MTSLNIRKEIIPLFWQEAEGFWRIELKNLEVEYFGDELLFSGKTMRRIERAVEKAYPGWHHRIKNRKCQKNCRACKEKELRKNIKFKSSI
jgi:hypothetical protein